jgi:hypothetical protein
MKHINTYIPPMYYLRGNYDPKSQMLALLDRSYRASGLFSCSTVWIRCEANRKMENVNEYKASYNATLKDDSSTLGYIQK